jgi:hypothetical protein
VPVATGITTAPAQTYAVTAEPLDALPAEAAPRQCPVCGSKLLPREHSCPKCLTKVDLSAPAVPQRPAVSDRGPGDRAAAPRPRPPRREADPARQALDRVEKGLRCHNYRIQAWVYGVFLAFAAVLIAPWFGGAALVVVFLGLLLAGALAPVLGITGSVLCLSVPEESSGKPFIVGSLVLDVAAVLAGVVAGVGAAAFEVPSPAASLLGSVIGFAAWVLLTLFLKRLGAYLGQPDLESEAGRLLLVGIALQLSPLLLILLVVLVGGLASLRGTLRIAGGAWAQLAALVLGVLLLAGLITIVVATLRFLAAYLRLLDRLGETIRGERGAYLYRGERAER